MMVIGSVTGTNDNRQTGNSSMNMQTDSVSKNIQNQIANAQKALQELSSNKDMELEEKMKKRQEIQQEITSLNQQLRQHQIEQRKEKQKGTSVDHMLDGNQKAVKGENGGSGLSQASMQAIISADSSMKQAEAQGSLNTQMEGRARVLKSEIEMDKSRGMNTEKKEKDLADLQERAQAATSSQLSMLADASKVMEEAAQADSNANSGTESTDKAAESKEKKDELTESSTDSSENRETAAVFTGEAVNVEVEAAKPAVLQFMTYTPIDVRV